MDSTSAKGAILDMWRGQPVGLWLRVPMLMGTGGASRVLEGAVVCPSVWCSWVSGLRSGCAWLLLEYCSDASSGMTSFSWPSIRCALNFL